jgi:ribonuclease HI
MATSEATMYQRLLFYSDGGARGNPGPAAIAYLALTDKSETVKAESRFIGEHTNNQAEYYALIAALEFAVANKVEEVICYLDSELVAKQLEGEYRVKNFELQKLWSRVQELKKCFRKISFENVPRTNICIQRADALLNKTLDENSENNSN